MKQSKVIVVTGGSSGIGLGICEEVLKAGHRVAVIDKKDLPSQLVAAQKAERLIFCKGCSYDETKANELIDIVESDWERIDGLVNNVGIFDSRPLKDMSLSDWREVIDTNLSSAFLFAKICEDMIRKQQGSIINISSTRAHQSEPNTEAYAASKGGILALTHALAISLQPDVKVNCISPGWIDTRSLAERETRPLRPIDHEQHPAGRVGTPEDIARFVLWLLDEQGGFITGQEFVLDGGMTRKMIYAED